MTEGFLGGTHEFIILLVFFALMLLSVEAGFRLGRKFETNTSAETKAQIAICRSWPAWCSRASFRIHDVDGGFSV